MPTIMLSDTALSLLRLNITGPHVAVTAENREAYRELAAAGLMYPVSTFAHGPESLFRFTEEGWRRREEWLSGHVPSLLPRFIRRADISPRITARPATSWWTVRRMASPDRSDSTC